MAKISKIEWCDSTINPAYGCSPISEGCVNCYAERSAFRLPPHLVEGTYDNNRWTGKINVFPKRMLEPAKWKKSKKIFVGSMSDVFHDNVSYEAQCEMIKHATAIPQHTWMFLTKRSNNLLSTLLSMAANGFIVPNNLWFGFTVCTQKDLEQVRFNLHKVSASGTKMSFNMFLSIEPMLGRISLTGVKFINNPELYTNILTGLSYKIGGNRPLMYPISPMKWVIVGGENTRPIENARAMKAEWVREIQEDCAANKVPFFFKGAGTAAGGMTTLDGVEYHEFPVEMPLNKGD